MRYVVIGAGAIGGTIAGRLAQHGSRHTPLLIARGANREALLSSGLRLRSPDEDVHVDVEVAAGPDEVRLEADDVLVFATKTPQVESALLAWADRPVHPVGGGAAAVGTAAETLPALLALNGVAAERIALRYFERVFGVCVWLPAVHLVPGEVWVRIAPVSGVLTVGRFAGPADAGDRRLLTTVQADWQASTFRVPVVDDIERWKYAKLLSNLANAVQALLGPNANASNLQRRVRAEAEEVLRAAHIEWMSAEEEAQWRGDDFTIRRIPGAPADLGGSSWQSLARGTGSIEADYLNGEIAYLAKSLGGQAPLNAGLARLARQAAVRGQQPGEMSVADLERLLATR